MKESLMIISSLKNNCPAVCVARCHRSHGKSVKKKYSNFLNIKRCISFFLRSKDGFLGRKIDEVYFFIFSLPIENYECSVFFSFLLSSSDITKIEHVPRSRRLTFTEKICDESDRKFESLHI